MDMLTGDPIAEANLTDWRKLGQGQHARYVVGDFGAGARFVVAVGEAGDALGHHPRVTMGDGDTDEHETRVSGSTSTSTYRPKRPSSGSTRRSRRAGSSLMTAKRRHTP